MNPKQFLDFALLMFKCKLHVRKAWTECRDDQGNIIRHEIKGAEHVLGHTGGLIMLLDMLEYVPSVSHQIDLNRTRRLALWHDILCEWEDGDTNDHHLTNDPVEKNRIKREKEIRERRSAQKACSGLPDEASTDLLGCWEEYAAGETDEAKLTHLFDKKEFLGTGILYLFIGHPIPMNEFLDNHHRTFENPWLNELVREIESRCRTQTVAACGI